jgi:hypothetical protein
LESSREGTICEIITHKKSYILVLNSSQDICNDFFVFITLRMYLTFLIDTNLTVDIIVHKELKFFGISRLFFLLFYIMVFKFFIF